MTGPSVVNLQYPGFINFRKKFNVKIHKFNMVVEKIGMRKNTFSMEI